MVDLCRVKLNEEEPQYKPVESSGVKYSHGRKQ